MRQFQIDPLPQFDMITGRAVHLGMMSFLRQIDPEVARILDLEAERQRNTINLIASENYASRAVLETVGSVLTNKYAEGYPHRRYYGGCENCDIAETLA